MHTLTTTFYNRLVDMLYITWQLCAILPSTEYRVCQTELSLLAQLPQMGYTISAAENHL